MAKVSSDLIVKLQEKVDDFLDDYSDKIKSPYVLDRVQRASTLLDEAANVQADADE